MCSNLLTVPRTSRGVCIVSLADKNFHISRYFIGKRAITIKVELINLDVVGQPIICSIANTNHNIETSTNATITMHICNSLNYLEHKACFYWNLYNKGTVWSMPAFSQFGRRRLVDNFKWWYVMYLWIRPPCSSFPTYKCTTLPWDHLRGAC